MPHDATPSAPPELAAGFQLSEIDPVFNADPLARLDPLREHAPVRRDPVFSDTITICTHAEARRVLVDPAGLRDPAELRPGNLMAAALGALFEAVRERVGPRGESPSTAFFWSDDPTHARLRGIVSPPFLKRVAAYRPEVERVVEDVLTRLEGRETFDLVDEFAVPIPVFVIASVMGVADADLAQFKAWSDGAFLMFKPLRSAEEHERCIASLAGLERYFSDLVQARKAAPRDDLTSDLVRAQSEGADISDAEIAIQLNMLLTAGNVTTTDMITNGALALLENPTERARLLADPSLAAPMVEEVLRVHPPATRTFRIASADGEIAGCPVQRGDMLTTIILAANHDPQAFPDPHRFDIGRNGAAHLAFGAGKRICLGAPLARLEGQLALLKLFQRFPSLRRADDDPIVWRDTAGQRGPAHLMVRT